MNLVLYNRIIDTDAEDILNKLKVDCEGKYLRQIKSKGDNVSITCPFHKDGQENIADRRAMGSAAGAVA